jgi:hypothetical protein
MPRDLPTKTCAACGRTMTWRRAWSRTWDEVRYCSDRCRRRGRKPIDAELESALRRLLDARPARSSVCPSEVARAVDADGWRDLMEPARAAARRLVAAGEVEMTQSGRAVDPSAARGPVRIRKAR